jgi:hypothetical protein
VREASSRNLPGRTAETLETLLGMAGVTIRIRMGDVPKSKASPPGRSRKGKQTNNKLRGLSP